MEREWDIYNVPFLTRFRGKRRNRVWTDATAASRWRMYRAYNEAITIMHRDALNAKRVPSVPLRRDVSHYCPFYATLPSFVCASWQIK